MEIRKLSSLFQIINNQPLSSNLKLLLNDTIEKRYFVTSAKESVAWSIGDIAIHKKWGEGTVLEVSGSGNTQELKINFPEVGLKKLLASVAPIEKK